jgi:CheY-like chemotaxis protein/HPt (histidine-containing phosphotransfer) domain-containing protein
VEVTDDFDPQLLPPGLLDGYLRSVQQQMNRLGAMADQIAASGDDADALDAFRREAHKIRGSAGSYGFHEATRVAAEIEETAELWVAGQGAPPTDRGVVAHVLIGRLRGMFDHPTTPDEVPDLFLIEDDDALIQLFQYGLSSRGYRTQVLRNGRVALETLRTLPVGDAHPLLLLDVDLPGLDGYSLFQALQNARPGVFRVVFLTVHGGEDEQLRALEGGATDYLVKPVSLRVALEKIRRWVGR